MVLRFAAPVCFLAAVVIVAALIPGASAQAEVPPCPEVPDFNDPGDDHSNADFDTLTGFDQIDLTTGCIGETADAIVLVTNTATAPEGGSTPPLTLTFVFHLTGSGTDYVATVTFDGASSVATEPPIEGASVIVSGTTVAVFLPRSGVGGEPGKLLGNFFVDSSAIFVTATGDILTSTDRAPDGTDVVFPPATPYQSGSRAPEGLDTDGDGVTDRGEIANGTDPNSLDTDHDGLLDGNTVEVETGSPEEANYTAANIYELSRDDTLVRFGGEAQYGTNASNPDTDGDGLTDGDNVTIPSDGPASDYFGQFGLSVFRETAEGDFYLGELGVGASPTDEDTDNDDASDYEEVTGEDNTIKNNAFIPDIDGSSNPIEPDSDGDGLLDGQEIYGQPPTDPNGPDTDSDGLTDAEELAGERTEPGGETTTFPPTDPTSPDSDGDSYEDGVEVAAGSDPMDDQSIPDSGGSGAAGDASYLWLSTVAMLVVGLLCVVGILVRWG